MYIFLWRREGGIENSVINFGGCGLIPPMKKLLLCKKCQYITQIFYKLVREAPKKIVVGFRSLKAAYGTLNLVIIF